MKQIPQDAIDELRAQWRRERAELVNEYRQARRELREDDDTRSGEWLPAELQGNPAAWKALANRRNPWGSVMKEGSTPDDVLAAMSSILCYRIMEGDAAARGRRLDSLMDMDTQI